MKKKWVPLGEGQTEKLFKTFKKTYGKPVASFIFFLTEGNEDYRIKEGLVWHKQLQEEAKT